SRLLDYAEEFSGQRGIVNTAITVTGEWHRLDGDRRRFGESSERDYQTSKLAHRILEITDEIEATTHTEPSEPPPPEPFRPRLVPPLPKSDTPRAEPAEEAKPRGETPLTSLERAEQEFTSRREPPSTATLVARGLRKRYRGGFSLSDVDLTLRPGEIVGLVGVNGSGKTTLLRILAGDLAADAGELTYPLLSGKRFDWDEIKSQIAFVAQRPPRWNGLLEANLHFHAAVRGIKGQANRDRVEFILHRLGLESYRKARWGEISGGFQMRFELAKALVARPKLLILDEPLAPLDVNTQQVFLQDLRDLADSFKHPLPILLSSQHIYEVEAITDSILFLDDGKVRFGGSLEKLLEEREQNTYELASPAAKSRLLELLAPLGVLDIENTGLTYLVNMPKETTGRKVMDALHRADVEVSYFRDVSGSTRRLFKSGGP
ncbi:MAG TPA: ABC transporter ATP-binding protein, partial [Thermoanaerobaculia bacterium]|nr:ABC transporter ATP-binding protein [Thermoanaerobaculia bacterium]